MKLLIIQSSPPSHNGHFISGKSNMHQENTNETWEMTAINIANNKKMLLQINVSDFKRNISYYYLIYNTLYGIN